MSVRQSLLWIALLISGSWVASGTTFDSGQSGAGAGIGFFSYELTCIFNVIVDSESVQEPTLGTVQIEGTAPRRFKFFGGVSPIYESVTLEWWFLSENTERPSEGTAKVDLTRMEIETEGRSLALNVPNLEKLFEINTVSQETAPFLDVVAAFLDDCKAGNTPPPRHHSYWSEEPVEVRIQHFANGTGVPYSVLVSIGLCLGLVVAIYVNAVSIRSNGGS